MEYYLQKIEEIRIEKKIKLAEFSMNTGISEDKYARWRKGSAKPSYQDITKALNFLQIKIIWVANSDIIDL